MDPDPAAQSGPREQRLGAAATVVETEAGGTTSLLAAVKAVGDVVRDGFPHAAILPGLRDAQTPFIGAAGLSLGQFWAWAYSDVLSNRNRGILAEFLVGAALDVLDPPRVEWAAYDHLYRGRRIEVKAASYIQQWAQPRRSTISFDIAPKLPDNIVRGGQLVRARTADCFVFGLFGATDPVIADVLDLGSWQFYVVASDVLPTSDRLGLTEIVRRAGAPPHDYAAIQSRVDALIDTVGHAPGRRSP